MRPDRESLFAERRQVCTGGIWFWSSVAEQAVRSRRICPLQRRVSSDTRKEISDFSRNEKKWYHGQSARLLPTTQILSITVSGRTPCCLRPRRWTVGTGRRIPLQRCALTAMGNGCLPEPIMAGNTWTVPRICT